ncbi:MAG: DNA-directed RNA polymerase subunit beta [Candidatus Pacebacteria bacterium]|nr:DNA-directed RNA polymerase subunit beta [Candidatus Paceibacterota bacterium]
MSKKTLPRKTFSKYREPLVPIPNLVETQVSSYKSFIEKGLKESIQEFFPIQDYSGNKFELTCDGFELLAPEFDEYYAKENRLTYEAQLKATIKLHNKTLNSDKEQEVFLSEIPMMTSHGTFVINGTERVVVPQLARSYGVFFTETNDKYGKRFGAKIIPARGAWIEIDTEKDGVIIVRIDKKRKFVVTSLLRVLGITTDDGIKKAFADNPKALESVELALKRDTVKDVDGAFIEIHKKLRDGELATVDNARDFINSLFEAERYEISDVGRYYFNKRFDLGVTKKDLENQLMTAQDVVVIIKQIVHLNNTPGSKADDIDHLGSRRVRYVGELLQQKVRKGMSQMKRNIQDRMSTIDGETMLPINIVNQRPLQARIKEFFSTSQLSQFMNQENVLSEIEHLRTLSALGPGGLTRERAGFEVRDVHPSHYGRVCPIHTPEGPNIGLILHLSLYARINDFGMIETPYAKVAKGVITGDIEYLNAMEEERYKIAHAGISYDQKSGKIEKDIVEGRIAGQPRLIAKNEVDYIDVATVQAFSVGTSLIPFLEHDDANRSLMGSNMQKQATPCIRAMAPLVATGVEGQAARDTGRLVLAEEAGTVTAVNGKKITVQNKKGAEKNYNLITFARTNNNSMNHQRAIVSPGDVVAAGDVLADTSTTDGGQTAIGQNVLTAFMCWNGHNFEDAIILSEKLVKNSIFTSIRVEEYECVVRDTKLGEEVTTHDIPNVGEGKLKNLDEDGIVRIGAEVRENDILVGKITPKGETELTPEERLLRSIFGEKARDVKDTSLRMGHGKKGRVVGVKVFSREQGHQLESGVLKKIYVEIAQLRNVQVGDKLAGRHGNKGVISSILPEEDMPYMADGTAIELILTPLGVPSRMNLGQILEMHLGLAAHTLGYQAIVPPFSGATVDEIKDELEAAGFSRTGKVKLYDGRTGEAFEQDIAVGYMYMLKLHHMIEDKMHARSVGPYSLITQQPLGGKSQSGGQRFGEMEVWALEGYGAAHTLREMLTIKSDDIVGRSQAFDSIIKGEEMKEPRTPASFKVLLHYLRGLSLDVEVKGRPQVNETYEKAEEVDASSAE